MKEETAIEFKIDTYEEAGTLRCFGSIDRQFHYQIIRSEIVSSTRTSKYQKMSK